MNARDKAARRYDAHRAWGEPPNEVNRERIEKTVALVPPGVSTVLDQGCGDGAVSNRLVDAGQDVTGVDVSAVALRHVRGRRVLAHADQVPFRERSFDLVLCAEVLEHLPVGVYERTVGEIERVARRYVLVSTPDAEYLPAHYVKCAQCGCVYHGSLHVRVFDRAAHRALFPRLDWAKTIGIGLRKYSPLAISLKQRLLGLHESKGQPTCPCCESQELLRPKLGLAGRAVLRGIRLLGKLFSRRRTARWLVSLYRVKEQAGSLRPL